MPRIQSMDKTKTMKTLRMLPAALWLLLPLAAQAADTKPTGIGAEIRTELADARKEVRVELAKAKRDLETENLRIDNSLRFGDSGRAQKPLPRAEITPQGDFLVEGKRVAVDVTQRRQLLAYRARMLEVAKYGIEIGQRSADAALDAVGNSSFAGLLFGGMTGSLERRIERTVKQQIAPAVRGLCRQMPALRDSQQRLAANLPQFKPYATLEADDIADCERDVRSEFASL